MLEDAAADWEGGMRITETIRYEPGADARRAVGAGDAGRARDARGRRA